MLFLYPALKLTGSVPNDIFDTVTVGGSGQVVRMRKKEIEYIIPTRASDVLPDEHSVLWISNSLCLYVYVYFH